MCFGKAMPRKLTDCLFTHAESSLTPPLPSVFQVVLQKSIPTQIRQLILHVGNSKGRVSTEAGATYNPKRAHLSAHFEKQGSTSAILNRGFFLFFFLVYYSRPRVE